MENYLKELFPRGKSYICEDWYKQISKEKKQFQRILLGRALLVASFFPIAVILLELMQGNSPQLLPSFLISLSMLTLHFLSTLYHGEKFSLISLLVIFLQMLACYFYSDFPLHILICVIIPMLGIQLLGLKKGVLCSLFFPFSFFILDLISMPIESLQPKILISPTLTFFCLGGFLLVLLLNVIIYRQHNRNLKMLLDNTLFDRVTYLPGQQVLKNHVKTMDYSIFAIIRVINFSELGLIFGYELSDSILIHTSEQLEKLGRQMGFSVYRLRGNEFGILKELDKQASDQRATSFLLDLYRNIENLMIRWQESHLTLNCLVGGTFIVPGNEEYLSQADLAVKEGLERHTPVVLFSSENTVREAALTSMNHYSILKDNLDEKTLETYFQPIIDSNNHSVIWYETLLRVKDKDGTMSSPMPFLTVAESTGLDRHLSDFVLKQACQALELLKTHISINVTFNDLKRPEFLESLEKYYPKGKTGEGKLILEILERQELHTLDSFQIILKKAKDMGCMIAIDDFGAGYSNYCNVLEIPADIIKIDGTLVQQIEHNPKARILVHNIIEFSKKLNLKVVAEYVDRHSIAQDLKSLGVDFLQGWLFGKAEPLHCLASL